MGQRTLLYDLHLALGAKTVDFGGWDMPLHYGSQVEEHHQVRSDCGVFDVSHMTVIDVTGRDAFAWLQRLLANDVARLAGIGKALYSPLLNEEGADNGETAAEAEVRLSEAHNKLLNLARLLALSAGLWLIWMPNLPALNLFDAMTLWTVNDSVNGVKPVTLVDLILALFILVVTFIATRHLPSLLQVIQLEFLRTSASVRYASTMLLQYALIAIGVSQFVGTLGWQWSQVQWLVAALGVGIGFGLQEIVANFISGLILLFERPISVGDVVTVDGHDGTVKRINIRATVIETFDRKELFVPNKDLITKQVVNWTHSDTAVRVLIGVGVAYGSDVRQAMALMLRLAEEHPKVLKNPPPQVSFDNFGDNSLMLTLRCFIAEERLAVSTELRTAINDRFAAEGIEISYPQRDLHVNFNGPLQIQRG